MAMSTIQLTLPCIGQELPADAAGDIEYETEIFTINGDITVGDLRSKLRDYHLSVTGKKAVLIDRLTQYAQDKSRWVTLFQSAPKRKRGQRTAERKVAHSTKRVARMFHEGDPKPVAYQMVNPTSDKRVVKPMTVYQQQQIDDWAARVIDSVKECDLENPEREEAWAAVAANARMLEELTVGQDTVSAPAAVAGSNLVFDESQLNKGHPMQATMRRVLHSVQDLQVVVVQTLQTQQTDASAESALPPVTSATSTQTHRPSRSRVGTNQSKGTQGSIDIPRQGLASVGGSSMIDTQQSWPSVATFDQTTDTVSAQPGPAPSIPTFVRPENLVTIQLGDRTLTVDRRTVPNPPSRQFSNNIPGIFAEWHRGTLLKLGNPAEYIPLKYWGNVYQDSMGIKRGAWNKIKAKYGNWKYIAEEKDALGSEQAFWDKYSHADGTRLRYQKILDKMMEERAARYTAGADAAKKFFQGNLRDERARGIFLCRGRDGTVHEYAKDQTISEKWQELLAKEPRIAAEWKSMQNSGRG